VGAAVFAWQTHSDEELCSDNSFCTMQFIYCTVQNQHKYLLIFYGLFQSSVSISGESDDKLNVFDCCILKYFGHYCLRCLYKHSFYVSHLAQES